VDAAHFRRGGPEPDDQARLPRPRLGFYGVIDERIDLSLLDALARAHPDWQIVMIGPVVKIDPATLPSHPNIHYLGQRRYDELPAYLAGWDVSLLPFALNDATRFISPTKTLEYMAAEHPIVSTPIRDVAGPYGNIVYLGEGPEAFVRACEAALASDPQERERRAASMRDVLARTSWDATAAAMDSLITTALRRRAELAVESVEV
jgi:UDP-galactopyranose mutase